MLSLNQELQVTPWQFKPKQHYLSSIVVEADFLMKKRYVASHSLELLYTVIHQVMILSVWHQGHIISTN